MKQILIFQRNSSVGRREERLARKQLQRGTGKILLEQLAKVKTE